MLKLIAALLALLLAGQVTFGVMAIRSAREARQNFNDAAYSRHWQRRAIRGEARADTLYRDVRIYITGADSLATKLRIVEGRYSQCMAQF